MDNYQSKNQEEIYLSGFLANRLPKILIGIGIFSAILLYIFGSHHPDSFFVSYLFSFMFFLTLTLGAYFFILTQHISRAGWSVVLRRIPETLMQNMDILLIFFIPLLFGLSHLYHWIHTEEVLKDHVLHAKMPYLNLKFFTIRCIVYFSIWILFVKFYYRQSVAQDTTGDANLTLKMQKFTPIALIAFAISTTFSGIDFVMSLTPHWYSTMYGVYIFAGAIVGGLSIMSLLLLILKKYGFLTQVTKEHFHDLGKLLYGFNIFWAYIGFSQYFLIWYASIPEETAWFHIHFSGQWHSMAAFLAIGHFVVPFILLMSRHVKRNLLTHGILAFWLLLMHAVDLFWQIRPHLHPNFIQFSIVDLLCVTTLGSFYFAVFFLRLKKQALLPIKDPRLEESLHLHNV